MTAGEPMAPGMAVRLRNWRNRLIASERFRSFAARTPILARFAETRANRLFGTVSGFVHSQILNAFVEAGLPGAMVGGARCLPELETATGLKPNALATLLTASARIGLVVELGDGYWALDDDGAVIAGEPGIAALIRHHAMLYRDLADPLSVLKGDRSDTLTAGFWAYAGSEDPEVNGMAAEAYSQLMDQSQAMMASQVVAAHDFAGYRRIADIGGGHGAFLLAAGAVNPQPSLVLFDLPAVVRRAQQRLEASAIAGRLSFAGGNFFSDPLPGDCDCYTLVRVLCDHDDSPAMRLLENLHRSMPRGTTLVIAEAMDDGSAGGNLAAAYFTLYFAAMGSGRCRSPSRIGEMLAKAGFSGIRHRKARSSVTASLILARA